MTTYGPPDFRKGPGLVDVGSGPVDWNWNVVIDEEPVFSNINNFGADAGCDGAGPILRGFNDWNNIQYVSSPATLPRPTPTISALSTTEELTALQQTDETDEQTIGNVRESQLVLLGGIDNAILRLIDSESETAPPAATVPEFDTSHTAELLESDQLDAAIAELLELKSYV